MRILRADEHGVDLDIAEGVSLELATTTDGDYEVWGVRIDGFLYRCSTGARHGTEPRLDDGRFKEALKARLEKRPRDVDSTWQPLRP
jgi:hypothetical protein